MIDIERICRYFDEISEQRITFGMDGFVDEVWQVLAKRSGRAEYALFDKMRDFAKSVYECGEGGYANEIIRKRRTYGGFVANTGKAAGRLGGNIVLVGMFGKETVDPVFREFQKECKLISVADPAICQIFEFGDGKLMLPFIEEAMDFNWDTLTKAVTWEELADAMDSDIVGMGYWSQLNEFDELVTMLCESFLAKGRCRRMFFDFADIRKREQKALMHTFDVLSKLDMPMSLSLNEHEAALLFSFMGRTFNRENPEDSRQDIDYARERAGLDELIVHTPYFAMSSTANEGTATVMQRYCKEPVITTGAGDNFNGGYLVASLAEGGLNLKERLFVGNAATGFYIRNGYSPDKFDLKGEMEKMRGCAL